MTRRTWAIAGGLLVLALAVGWWLISRSSTEDPATVDSVTDATTTAPEPIDEDIEQAPVDLYFPGEAGKLYVESRLLPVMADPKDQIQQLVDALLEGPESESLRPPLSEGAKLRQVYLMGGSPPPDAEGAEPSRSLSGQTVVLDFETVGGMPPRTTGSQRERLMVYSLVNSTLLNFDDGQGVLILWNGQQNVTFGGHLDIGRPLKPALDLVARREPPPYSADEDYLPALFDAPVEEGETEGAPEAGVPAAGDPAAGDPAAGDPVTGVPAGGEEGATDT